jgi:PadR family transcriptional regulator PadR
MNLENSIAQMRKGILEYCVLGIIAKGEVYPGDMISSLKSAELIVVEGTLYPLLTRLKNAELVSYKWVESIQGPPRKYFTITDKGKQFFEELEKGWQSLITSINNVVK